MNNLNPFEFPHQSSQKLCKLLGYLFHGFRKLVHQVSTIRCYEDPRGLVLLDGGLDLPHYDVIRRVAHVRRGLALLPTEPETLGGGKHHGACFQVATGVFLKR